MVKVSHVFAVCLCRGRHDQLITVRVLAKPDNPFQPELLGKSQNIGTILGWLSRDELSPKFHWENNKKD